MRYRSIIALTLLLAACGQRVETEVPITHPASAQAVEVPPTAVSTTLDVAMSATSPEPPSPQTQAEHIPNHASESGHPAQQVHAQTLKRDAETPKTGVVYSCPMHPEIVSDHPGQCPTCHMELAHKTEKRSDK